MSLKRVIYLTDSEYDTLKSTGSVEIGGQIYTPSAETEFRVIAKTKPFKHILTWNRHDQNGETVEEQYYNTIVDNYPTAYTEQTLIEKYGPYVSFVACNQMQGPPGSIAVFGNRFKIAGGGDDDTFFYGFYRDYSSPIDVNDYKFELVNDAVIEL